ncbi:trimeric intracellular cation channel family protein [Rufibacter glacialis]|uniref:Trimeric intracellular cation channel family protein n=1 Tax=Rufibacter glacialis TaxID=1259555 RepID=A0A5M8QT10_9BACT|nr:trimeric intracellular cation channel family protein [Rufibacter glacialis]KAA6438180.1 trimeric intracellular cation channel family protein [Rufibacter glacialis]GGK89278.1 membrane protein [Rufibacter glacialis]
MERLHFLYYVLDLAGTFAFAISGATAARKRNLDLFGICALAFTVACGGGIIRDLCIGAIPPAGLTNWQYLAASLFASALTVHFFPLVQRLKRPVLFFDSVGLALFAVTGAEKALHFGHNGQVAVMLGITTAVGGGVIRDVLLNRVPVIMEKEIYASAALLGAVVVVVGNQLPWVTANWAAVTALLLCFTLRILALYFHWNLPTPGSRKTDQDSD